MHAHSLIVLSLACAPAVHVATTQAIVAVESAGHPYAIGVVGGVLLRQPRTLPQAAATAHRLQLDGWDFSAGLAQINRRNWPRLGLTESSAFDGCENLRAMQSVLQECYERAARAEAPPTSPSPGATSRALRGALSCYSSGRLTGAAGTGYVERAAAARPAPVAASGVGHAASHAAVRPRATP